MTNKCRPMIVIGTRPELIKLYPVVLEFRSRGIEPLVVLTGQHTSLLQGSIECLDIGPCVQLNLMQENQRPEEFLASALAGLTNVLDSTIGAVIVQGDTTSTFAGALCGFYNKVPVAHVEAGLRTQDLSSPFPEEGHRQMVGRICRWHFVPTEVERYALSKEGVPAGGVIQVGNTAIDTLRLLCIKHKIEVERPSESTTVIVTLHRRESFDHGLSVVASAIARLATYHPRYNFILPLHPNPMVANAILPPLANLSNVKIVEPMPYIDFIKTLCMSRFVISDSGGVQEEAPWLGRPVVVVRNTTERRQAIDQGASFLVGTSSADTIFAVSESLMTDTPVFSQAAQRRELFGDGFASTRIVDVIISSGVTPD